MCACSNDFTTPRVACLPGKLFGSSLACAVYRLGFRSRLQLALLTDTITVQKYERAKGAHLARVGAVLPLHGASMCPCAIGVRLLLLLLLLLGAAAAAAVQPRALPTRVSRGHLYGRHALQGGCTAPVLLLLLA